MPATINPENRREDRFDHRRRGTLGRQGANELYWACGVC
jgi:hypothetical protein